MLSHCLTIDNDSPTNEDCDRNRQSAPFHCVFRSDDEVRRLFEAIYGRVNQDTINVEGSSSEINLRSVHSGHSNNVGGSAGDVHGSESEGSGQLSINKKRLYVSTGPLCITPSQKKKKRNEQDHNLSHNNKGESNPDNVQLQVQSSSESSVLSSTDVTVPIATGTVDTLTDVETPQSAFSNHSSDPEGEPTAGTIMSTTTETITEDTSQSEHSGSPSNTLQSQHNNFARGDGLIMNMVQHSIKHRVSVDWALADSTLKQHQGYSFNRYTTVLQRCLQHDLTIKLAVLSAQANNIAVPWAALDDTYSAGYSKARWTQVLCAQCDKQGITSNGKLRPDLYPRFMHASAHVKSAAQLPTSTSGFRSTNTTTGVTSHSNSRVKGRLSAPTTSSTAAKATYNRTSRTTRTSAIASARRLPKVKHTTRFSSSGAKSTTAATVLSSNRSSSRSTESTRPAPTISSSSSASSTVAPTTRSSTGRSSNDAYRYITPALSAQHYNPVPGDYLIMNMVQHSIKNHSSVKWALADHKLNQVEGYSLDRYTTVLQRCLKHDLTIKLAVLSAQANNQAVPWAALDDTYSAGYSKARWTQVLCAQCDKQGITSNGKLRSDLYKQFMHASAYVTSVQQSSNSASISTNKPVFATQQDESRSETRLPGVTDSPSNSHSTCSNLQTNPNIASSHTNPGIISSATTDTNDNCAPPASNNFANSVTNYNVPTATNIPVNKKEIAKGVDSVVASTVLDNSVVSTEDVLSVHPYTPSQRTVTTITPSTVPTTTNTTNPTTDNISADAFYTPKDKRIIDVVSAALKLGLSMHKAWDVLRRELRVDITSVQIRWLELYKAQQNNRTDTQGNTGSVDIASRALAKELQSRLENERAVATPPNLNYTDSSFTAVSRIFSGATITSITDTTDDSSVPPTSLSISHSTDSTDMFATDVQYAVSDVTLPAPTQPNSAVFDSAELDSTSSTLNAAENIFVSTSTPIMQAFMSMFTTTNTKGIANSVEFTTSDAPTHNFISDEGIYLANDDDESSVPVEIAINTSLTDSSTANIVILAQSPLQFDSSLTGSAPSNVLLAEYGNFNDENNYW